jgi:hypothetical protein
LSVLTTNQKGAIAEAAVAKEAIQLGIGVYSPYGDERCDFIFDLRPRLVRVQVKWASRNADTIRGAALRGALLLSLTTSRDRSSRCVQRIHGTTRRAGSAGLGITSSALD